MATSAMIFVYGREMDSTKKFVSESISITSDGSPDTILMNLCGALVDTQKRIDQYNDFRRRINSDADPKTLANSPNILANFIVAYADSNYYRTAFIEHGGNKFPTAFTKAEIDHIVYGAPAEWVYFIDLVNSIIYLSNDNARDFSSPEYCSPFECVKTKTDDYKESTERDIRGYIEKIGSYGLSFAD